MFGKYKRGYKRYHRGSSKIIWGILIVCLVVSVYCGYKISLNTSEYNEGVDVYKELAQNKSINEEIDFPALAKINPEVVAWITSKGVGLDYPIVQGTNNDYYLTHLFDGTPNKAGSIFMDYENDPTFKDKNTVIYGHNMKNGSMFSVLMNYKNQEFLNEHPRIDIKTPNGDYIMKIFSGFVVDTTDFEAKLEFDSNAEFMNYINKLLALSNFESNVIVKPSDRIVTLYTCSYEYQTARYVLFGII